MCHHTLAVKNFITLVVIVVVVIVGNNGGRLFWVVKRIILIRKWWMYSRRDFGKGWLLCVVLPIGLGAG